jgi:hypothetical protein
MAKNLPALLADTVRHERTSAKQATPLAQHGEAKTGTADI